jgi:hypothetical protein
MVTENIRDILLSIYLGLGIVLTLVLIIGLYLLFRALLALIRAARKPLENLSQVTEAAVEHIVKPLKEGVSFANVMGGSLGFVNGFVGSIFNRTIRRGKDDKRRR